MELNHLKYFYEVARQGSFTRASKTLRVSQPSISKVIKQLEERESVKLLDRNKRSVRLTPTGEIYFRKCQLVFEELRSLQREVAGKKSECAGELGVGASDSLCDYIFPDLFADFCRRYPRVQVRIFSGASREIKAEMLADKLEVGVFFTPPRESQLEALKLGFVEFAVVCAGKSARFPGASADRKALLEQPLIGCGNIEYVKSYPVLRMLKSLGVTPHYRLETNIQETQKRFALRDEGYAVLPRYMVREEAKAGTLRILRTAKPIGADVYLVRRKGRTLSHPAQVFHDYLKASLLPLITGGK